MPSTVRLHVDVKDVVEALDGFRDQLDQPIRDVFEGHGKQIADIAAGFMRKGQPPWPSSSGARYGDSPGTIASYFDSRASVNSLTIGTTHPAGPVWEWGGEIHPAAGKSLHAAMKAHPQLRIGHQVIVIPRTLPATRAADADAPALTRDLSDAVDRLIAEHFS